MTDILTSPAQLRSQAERSVENLPGLVLRGSKAASSLLQGMHKTRKTGTGDQFWQFRDYDAISDAPRQIDWRQSGKGDQVFTRENEQQNPQSAFFWCASGPGMFFAADEKSKLESAALATTALAVLTVRGGEKIGSWGQQQVGSTDQALERLAQYLIEISDNPDTQNDLPNLELFLPPRNAFLFLTGDFLQPLKDIKVVFEALAARTQNVVVTQILTKTERELSYDGRGIFEFEKQQSATIENIADIREAYQERLNKHIDGLQRLCDSLGWKILSCDETPDFDQIYADLHGQLAEDVL